MLCHKHHKIADGHNVSDKKLQQRYLDLTMLIVQEDDYQLVKRDYEFIEICKSRGLVLL